MIDFTVKKRAATELAPPNCIVCGKPNPLGKPTAEGTLVGGDWVYLAGAKPIGCIACSTACAEIAIVRFHKTGRCDTKGLS